MWKGEARAADADKAKRASVLECILYDVDVDVQGGIVWCLFRGLAWGSMFLLPENERRMDLCHVK